MCSHLALKTNITVNICEDKQINGWRQPLVMWPSWQFMNECVWTGEQVIGEGEEPGEVRTEGSQSYILGCDLSDMTWMHVSDSNNKKGLNSCIKVVNLSCRQQWNQKTGANAVPQFNIRAVRHLAIHERIRLWTLAGSVNQINVGLCNLQPDEVCRSRSAPQVRASAAGCTPEFTVCTQDTFPLFVLRLWFLCVQGFCPEARSEFNSS